MDRNIALEAAAVQLLAKHPKDSERIFRGLKLAKAGAVRRLDAERCEVAGSKGAAYTVTRTGCSCPDATHRPETTCKHRWAVAACAIVDAEEARDVDATRRPLTGGQASPCPVRVAHDPILDAFARALGLE